VVRIGWTFIQLIMTKWTYLLIMTAMTGDFKWRMTNRAKVKRCVAAGTFQICPAAVRASGSG
jgi:hypothetical protein